jgi:hypothetical protein
LAAVLRELCGYKLYLRTSINRFNSFWIISATCR